MKKFHNYLSEADPGFMDRGFIYIKVCVCVCGGGGGGVHFADFLIFLKYHMKIFIGYLKTWGGPPLDPPLIFGQLKG